MVARKQMKGKQPMQSYMLHFFKYAKLYVNPAHKSNNQGKCWWTQCMCWLLWNKKNNQLNIIVMGPLTFTFFIQPELDRCDTKTSAHFAVTKYYKLDTQAVVFVVPLNLLKYHIGCESFQTHSKMYSQPQILNWSSVTSWGIFVSFCFFTQGY